MVAAQVDVDVLVVGAGPTGLALASQLARFGTRVRIIDRGVDRARESRAMAIQPRTLEALAPLGLARSLVGHGSTAVGVIVHSGHRTARVGLTDLGIRDTAYPYLLFVSQAVTESVLLDHLAARGVAVERRTALVGLAQDDGRVSCVLRSADGSGESIRAGFVVGADGARSTVRGLAGIDFPGSDYPQTFVLADLEADGLEVGSAHAFLDRCGILLFFPLGEPATWRAIAMVPHGRGTTEPLTLTQVQTLVGEHAPAVRLHDPAWLTTFRLHSRRASAMRSGRVFLAGDAAHIHSPAGAQGMNTGIQDALNLGWKLALVTEATSPPSLLDTYDPERAPVARRVLAMADRAFRIATTTRRPVADARASLAPRLLPLVRGIRPLRVWGARTVAQLTIAYPDSPLTLTSSPHQPRRLSAGRRLPDAPLGGATIHGLLRAPGFHLLLCGPASTWPSDLALTLCSRRPRLHVHVVRPEDDPSGRARRSLGWNAGRPRALLVRPDGHLAGTTGRDLEPIAAYLDTWLPRRPPGTDRG